MASDRTLTSADAANGTILPRRSLWQRDFFGINGPVKRALDIAIALPAIIFLLPLLLAIAIAIRVGGGPVIFRQQRVGRGGVNFPMFKFRTMHVDAEARLAQILATSPQAAAEWNDFQKLSNDPRITAIGGLLRRSSLDELPQLFNVLLGHMSLVGQRPILPQQRSQYGAHLEAYEAARPGITGLWQVTGRNATTFNRRAEVGSIYLRRWSLVFDLKLIVMTLPAVFSAQTS